MSRWKNPSDSCGDLEDIAADVEHREALAVGENSHGAARYQRGRQNVIIRTDSHDHARRARILAKTFAHLSLKLGESRRWAASPGPTMRRYSIGAGRRGYPSGRQVFRHSLRHVMVDLLVPIHHGLDREAGLEYLAARLSL